MPRVLTTNAIITCPHGSPGTSVPGSTAWKVNGGAVLVENDVGTIIPASPICWCSKYTLQSMKLNATTINGRRVILETDFNQTDLGLPLIVVEAHTTLDNSTTAPLPPLGPLPPLPPEMLDQTKPVVTAAIPVATFSKSGGPPTLVITFTLAAAFPLKWVLTRVGEKPAGGHEELTAGTTAGTTVSPAGGVWSSPSQTVTLTMKDTYMQMLPLGDHDFFMTGVSRRGVSNFRSAKLTVAT